MKAMVIFAVVGLMAASVSAHGGSGGGFLAWLTGCSCTYNWCAKNTGTTNLRCGLSKVQYIGCQNEQCTANYCPANNLFNYTSKVCEPCPAGFHVDAFNQTCVCNQGTVFNRTSKSCVACPTNAVVTPDTCYCAGNTVYDKTSNACKNCPAGSTMKFGKCSCNDRKQFWNSAAFACQNCPGTWVNVSVGGFFFWRPRYKEVCQCQGANQFFNKLMVSCMTCPPNSTAVNNVEDSFCKCTNRAELYDIKTNKCVTWSFPDWDGNWFGW